MAAYELFAATTTDLFIANIKDKAEAYGWTIDFFGLYSSHNRLHLHNSDGAHFEIWYASASAVYICGCTGYSSGGIPTAQPGVSSSAHMQSNRAHFVAIGKHSICVETWPGATANRNVQFGHISDKIGAWDGGTFISNTYSDQTGSGYWHTFWMTAYGLLYGASQVYINGAWSTFSSTDGRACRGIVDEKLRQKMPFAYSGGILPIPILLLQVDAVTPTLFHPLGYAPDLAMFDAGNAYAPLDQLTIGGEVWLAINQSDNVSFVTSPNTLIRLAV